jgi:lipopolysaccharide transport system permease protein
MNKSAAVKPSEVVMKALCPNSQLPVRVITPHDGTEAFKFALSSLLRDWRVSRDLAWRIFVRDTQASFRGSFLGWLWIVLPVLANSLVWMFLSGTSVLSIKTGTVPYPLFVFVGNLLWVCFNNALVGGLGVLNEAQGTLGKVNFPPESLVVVVLWKSFLNLAVTLLALPMFLLLYPVPWRSEILLFPIGVVLTIGWGLSLGLILVPVAALFQDLSRAVHLSLRFLFFLTPVVFPLPESGIARTLMLWNPATCLITASRGWLLGGERADVGALLSVGAASVLLLAVGVIALKVSIPHIVERTAGG